MVLLNRARNRGESGATLVEFAIIAPLLFALLLGIMTAGLAYSADVSLNAAAREGARFGATRPVDSDLPAWLNSIVDVVIDSATGDLDDGQAGRTVCVAYVYPDGTEIHDRTARIVLADDGTRTQTAGATCLADGRPNDERRVQVVAAREADIQAIIYHSIVGLKAEAVVRYERANP